jgi:hypothetical protein
LKLARQQALPSKGTDLNIHVERILAECGYDKVCEKMQSFKHNDTYGDSTYRAAKRVIKLSKRNISIEELRKKKDKKTK